MADKIRQTHLNSGLTSCTLLLASILLTHGCAGRGHYVTQSIIQPQEQAAPSEAPPGITVKTQGLEDGAPVQPVKMFLVGKGTTLLIPPLGRNPATVNGELSNLVIEMVITAHSPGVVMNTSGVVIMPKADVEYRSRGLLAPSTAPGRTTKRYAKNCVRPVPNESENSAENIDLMPGTDYCFAFRFDSIPQELDQPVVLRIDGLYETGRQVVVPVMRYSPTTGEFTQTL